MILPIKLLDVAEIEASEAIDWYENEEFGLGTKFRKSIEAAISSIQKHSVAFPVVHGSHVRNAQVRKFPFTIFFTIRADRILVYSIFHHSRNPIIWRRRFE